MNKARDVHRHPYETLSFFDVKADSTVVEISPGGGWYSEILAPLLKEKGKYYAAHQPADATSDYAKRTRAAYLEKLATGNNVQLQGATGELRMDGFGNVVRTPAWSTFSGGRSVPVSGGG